MEALFDLQDNLLLIFTGFSRSAISIFEGQHMHALSRSREASELHYQSALIHCQKTLEACSTSLLDELMHEQWKKRCSSSMGNPHIDERYELGCNNGVMSGNLVEAVVMAFFC